MTDEQGQPFISPCMDDLLVTSVTLREHIWHMRALAERARTSGFEFKLKKGQFNQETVEFWGCLLSKDGRKPQPKKIEQMTKWPPPVLVKMGVDTYSIDYHPLCLNHNTDRR